MTFNAFLESTDRILPHDILGAGSVAVLALLGLILHPGLWWLWVPILILGVAVAVDLSAHGWTH